MRNKEKQIDNRIEKKTVKLLVLLGVLVLVALACFVFIRACTKQKHLVNYVSGDLLEESEYVSVSGDMVFEQTFTASKPETVGVDLKFLFDENAVREGEIIFTLYDEVTGQPLTKGTYTTENLVINENTSFVFGEVIALKEQPYRIEIIYQGIPEAMKLQMATADGSVTRTSLDGVEQTYGVYMGSLLTGTDAFLWEEAVVTLLVIASIIVGFLMLFVIGGGNKFRFEQVYLVVALLLGLAYSIIIPVMSVPDEPVHLAKAYSISNQFMGVANEDGHVTMRECDAKINFAPVSVHRAYLDYYWEDLLERPSDTSLVKSKYEIVPAQSFLYFFSALGITLGRLLGLGAILTFMLGRLFNTLFFVWAMYYAIKKIPFGKAVLFIWAMLPIMLQQANSYSYDSFVIACCALVIAITMNLMFGEKLETSEKEKWYMIAKRWVIRPQVIILFLTCLFLFPCKGHAMFPVILLPFMIPVRWLIVNRKNLVERFKSLDKKYKATIGAIFGVVFLIGCLIGYKFVKAIMASASIGGTVSYNGQPGYALADLFQNPMRTAVLFGNTMWVYSGTYLTELFGGSLGWLDIMLPLTVVLPFALLLILAGLRKENEDQPLTIGNRLWMWFVFVAICGISILGMLFSWTPRYQTFIRGVQGRYFLPALPLVFLALRSKKVCIGENTDKILVYVAIYLQILVEIGIFKTMI